ncbi:hypothetical protein COCC4DRAFT_204265 [Bipolaris maydis ATCC 48331]|uniref:Uncharacterized protein n=2 Tax=Cochliobolus heterostrophus TaxID=5016 RepID=M2SH97_COCH5|nr:uncharacterized protein COCC4DRAFT_204265 [Bipolaris maydis ATCC 48331]EMD84755.1 hypothetical protein COCHEDRAFT_1189278 [Bipolaris maydis C5]KAH7558028.1 hypothetical protein BM1_05300 [Bipolaris maydis]EMD97425.1 hypothetical protein COCHEDRAFT_1164314 [Bipolaris maydis C5]ENI01436.1 hypothetical protein COCC4DRAFT_204265 [Bipolaris maydis ATCC 48331]KAJ5031122.1 hypothetical protein J3E73DRAFT_818 [Bipolaris maydis]
MATADQSAQFREPPVGALPEATSTFSSQSDVSAQFREPVTSHSSTDSTTIHDPINDGPADHKPVGEKIKNVLKKPFSSSTSGSSNKLGEREITSPEMEAAKEVLTAKDLRSP